MADLKRFARNIAIKGDQFVEKTDALIRRVALAVDTAVVLATPVDTGRARANWQVGLGRAPSGTLAAPGSAGEGTSNALNAAQAAIASYHGGVDIHISNNLPYIEALNNGHSSQAPSGYVERAIVAGIDAVGARGRLV